MDPISIRALSGSLREGSLNTALLRAAAELAPSGVIIELLDYRAVPFYDADLGTPPEVERVKAAITEADALLISTPEYNYSVPGVLKNVLDWASRPAYRSPLRGKPVAVLSAAPGQIGGARAQQHLKTILLGTASPVFAWPEFLLSRSKERIVDGRLVDEKSRELLGALLAGFVREVRVRRALAEEAS